MDTWQLQRKITDAIIALEDEKRIVLDNMYPSEVARRIVLEIEELYSGTTRVWMLDDPTKYFPGWSIYKTIANGFSWKGRKRG